MFTSRAGILEWRACTKDLWCGVFHGPFKDGGNLFLNADYFKDTLEGQALYRACFTGSAELAFFHSVHLPKAVPTLWKQTAGYFRAASLVGMACL